MCKENKKCVSFWIEKELINAFDEKYHAKSFFIKECIKRAVEDLDFYIEITTGKKQDGKKEIL